MGLLSSENYKQLYPVCSTLIKMFCRYNFFCPLFTSCIVCLFIYLFICLSSLFQCEMKFLCVTLGTHLHLYGQRQRVELAQDRFFANGAASAVACKQHIYK